MTRDAHFDMAGYASADLDRHVRRTLSSWDDPGWRTLLVQQFEHLPRTDELILPPSTDHHLWLITHGAGTIQINTGDGWRTTPIAAGLIGAAVPGRPTAIRYASTTPMRSIHVHLTADLVNRAAAELGVGALPPTVHDPAIDLLAAMLRSLAAAAQQGVDDLYAQTAAQFLAVHLVAPAGDAGTRHPGRDDVRVRRAVAFMRDRLGSPVSLGDIAASAGLSPYHFLRVFKQATGTTPGRYLTRLRVEQAKRLLDRGLTLAQIARRCGFAGPGHLSATFLRETGVRPSTYRAHQ